MGDRVLIEVPIAVTPLEVLRLPPLSSRILKTLIETEVVLRPLKKHVESREKYKPLFISNLSAGGQRLYASSQRSRRSIINPGETLWGRIAAVVPAEAVDEINMDVAGSQGSSFRTPFGEMRIEIPEVRVVASIEVLKQDLERGFAIYFHTPALLSPKLMIPPLESWRRRYEGLKVGYTTLPIPGLILAYSLRLLAAAYPNHPAVSKHIGRDPDKAAFKTALLGTVFTETIHHRIWPETVIIGRDGEGKLRKARGFRGMVALNIRHRGVREAASYSLALAEKLGLGRGRGMGLGEIEVKPKP